MQESCDFEIAQEYGEDDGLFDKIFETLSGNEGTRLRVLNKREFTTFYNILCCWQEDAGKVRDQKSSAVKRYPGVFQSSLAPVVLLMYGTTIAAMQVGKILLKKMAEHKFFVVAIYLNKNMIASQYIVMQTGQDNDEPTEEFHQGNAVSIHCNNFDLTNSTEATESAREMYNLVGELNDLTDDLDRNMA
ncbi:hypothetical protein EDC04DRAFT_2609460 [Pisolithus marmoratus]|nr:hypothetical protein EDC04DRAFT_2609460 [Pisolithus marmoratus]